MCILFLKIGIDGNSFEETLIWSEISEKSENVKGI